MAIRFRSTAGLPKLTEKINLVKKADRKTSSIRVKSIKSVFYNSKRISLPKFSENINLAIKTQALSVSNPLNPCSITQNVWVYLSFTENINLAIETQILSVFYHFPKTTFSNSKKSFSNFFKREVFKFFSSIKEKRILLKTNCLISE